MAIPFLKSLFPTKSFLGVDIGTTTIKIVELKRSQGLPELLNYGLLESYGHLERINNAIQTSTLKLADRETTEFLKILLKYGGFKSREAVASIPAFASFTAMMELPLMSEKETSQAMQFQAKQYIPLPVSSVTIDWIKVDERLDQKGNAFQKILLVSVPNEQIQKYKTIFDGAGLNLTTLEIEGLSSARSITNRSDKTSLIVDIGARSTGISVARNGLLKFSGQTDFAGGSLTQTLATGLNIRARRAEDLKKQRGLKGIGGEYELSTLMLPILDVIINEVRRVRDDYERGYTDKIQQVILSGGGANLLGVGEYFQGELGLPTMKAGPFSQVSYSSEIEPLISDLSSEFPVAIGLAMRGFQ
ncbi:MAG: type IV pilus assembly protein PilM [Candidatus Harrisonbacteria bacterium]|nr:type IV pilus assembly protein PilM [Candidatus Harrisonbacteria bacterium]